MKPKALYVLHPAAYDLVYGHEERADVAELAEVYAPPQTAQSVTDDPSLLQAAEILLSGWGAPMMDEAFLRAAPNLRAVFYGAGSVRYFVTNALWERGVRITSAYAANAVPVAEYTLASVLFSLKRVWAQSAAVRVGDGRTRQLQVPGAYGATVGILSLGMVGRLVAEYLQPFDVNVVAYDPYADADDAGALGVTLISMEDVFSSSDVVSVHTPWLPETEGIIKGEHIASMRHDATLINTSRGAIIRESEMVDTLHERPDLWAVLDVTRQEPPEPHSPLYTLPNVFLTPHIAGSQGAECRRMGRYMVDELRRFVSGEHLAWEITRDKASQLA